MSPVVLLVFAVLPIAGFVIGNLIARKPVANQLTKAERQELHSQRQLISELTAMAGEHIALGDQFAVLALTKINEHGREIR